MEINIWIKYDKLSNGLYLIFFWGGGGGLCIFSENLEIKCYASARNDNCTQLLRSYMNVHTTDVTKSLACALSIRRLARLTSWATVLGMLRLPTPPPVVSLQHQADIISRRRLQLSKKQKQFNSTNTCISK